MKQVFYSSEPKSLTTRFWKKLLPIALILTIFFVQDAIYLEGAPPPRKGDDKPALAGPGWKENIVYKTIGNIQLKLDLYNPSGETKGLMPAHVYIHGGGWNTSSKADARWPRDFGVFERLSKAGFMGITIDYRLAKNGVTMQDVIQDSKDAIRFLYKEGQHLGIDTNRIAVWGGSAGGHLAMMAAFTDDHAFAGDPDLATYPSKVKAVVSWCGPTDLVRLTQDSSSAKNVLEKVISKKLEEAKDLYQEDSPITYLKAGCVPTLLLAGDQDTLIPPNQADIFQQKAKPLGISSEYILVKNAGHMWKPVGSINPSLEEIHRLTAEFITKHTH